LVIDTTGVTFTDMTTHTLSGRVGGGCGRSIGDVIITLQSENSCLVRSVTTDTEYSISLPPQSYLVTAAVVESTITDTLNKPDVIAFFQNLGQRRVSLANADATLDFIYRAPLQVVITGMETYATCDSLTFGGRVFPADLPVIPQGTPLELMIEVEEDYGPDGTCALDNGFVTVYDEISDREDKPVVLEVRNGIAGVVDTLGQFIPGYRTMATTPSLIIGRTDEQGNDRSFQKYVRTVAIVEGRTPVTATEWALVTGHVAPEGAGFVTFATEPMPFYILRDPPGDNSYAFLDEGYTSKTTVNFDINSVSYDAEWGENNLIDNLRWGLDVVFAVGVEPWAVELNFAGLTVKNSRATLIETVDSTGTTIVSTNIDEHFATSPDELWVGQGGDIFIGAGLNYIFARVGVVEVEGCQVVRSDAIGVEPDGFATAFAYTEQHIAGVLIPDLESMVEHYDTLGIADSLAFYQEVTGSWKRMLAVNDTLKWRARLKENRSFSAGADYMYSVRIDSTETFRTTTTLFTDKETDSGSYDNILGSYQRELLNVDIDRHHEVEVLEDTTQTWTSTVGYVLSDDDIGDHFTVDVKQDGRYPSPVFDVRAGASSCPYEPWPDPSGEARMLARDSTWLDIVPARRDSIQPDEAAVFMLNLVNLSETQEPRLYALRLLTTSNPHGAIVKVGGETIMNGLQQYYIEPMQVHEATLTVERGPTWYDYDNLAVILYPPCEYALWEQGGPLQQADTLYFSVSFEDTGPVVFGTPQPADGELSFGEDISITFDEEIDCASILPDSITLTYLDGPSAGSTIALNTVCDRKTMILDPAVSENDLEGRRLRARVSAIRDRAGNMMSGAVPWDFDYRKSRFTWSQLYLTSDVAFRNPGVLQAELVNGTGETVDFTITERPDTIAVEPPVGTILPGGKQSVSLIPKRDLADGVYEFQIQAEATDPTQGVAVLNIHLTVSCQEPTWVVNPSGFQHNMTMVAQLDTLGGALKNDKNDRVAAFVGNQLRGVADIDSVVGLAQPYVAFLTIYSNRPQGETVRFQVWDDDSCRLYNSTVESHPFDANDMIGSPNSPVTLTATDFPLDTTLTIAANEGWTWISTNVRSMDMTVTGVLSDLTAVPGDVIKSQAAFSQFVDDSTGWSGTLLEINNVSGYMVKLSGAGTILSSGAAVDTLIPVVRYWNWIGYLPQGPFAVANALADLGGQSLLSNGDVVKSQDAFAEYFNGTWYGNLDDMEPGKGYKLYLENASAVPGANSFLYPVYGGSPPPPLVATADGDEQKRSPVEGTPSWSVNPHGYQHNMTVTGVLRIDGRESIDESDMIGAFVGDDCRGVARPVYVEGVQRHEVFLMVCSNEAAGERVTLRAFDANVGLIYDVTETLTFEADKVEGTVQGPVVFTAETVWGGNLLPPVFALSQNYPNPFNPTTTIDYDVPASGGHVTLRIYDVAGRLVRTLVNGSQTPGSKTVAWDGRSSTGQLVATGVYFYRMTAPGFVKTRKMVMMK